MTLQISLRQSLGAILERSHEPLVVDHFSLPSKLEVGQVLIKLISSGICGAQLSEIDAVKGPDKFLPHLLGHEGFGKVVEVGPGVTRFSPGDKVVLHWKTAQGIQSQTPRYEWKYGQLNAGWVTTFNEFAIISENRATRIDVDSLRIDAAFVPLLGCAVTTAYGAISRETRVSMLDKVMVVGAGGVGLFLVYFLKLMGVRSITVIDKYETRLEESLRLGATCALKSNADENDDISIYSKIIHEFDVAYETSGSRIGIELAYNCTKENGQVLLIGVPNKNNPSRFQTLPLHYGKTLRGSNGGLCKPEVDIPLLTSAFNSKHFDSDLYPVRTYALQEINAAISAIKNGEFSGRASILF